MLTRMYIYEVKWSYFMNTFRGAIKTPVNSCADDLCVEKMFFV